MIRLIRSWTLDPPLVLAIMALSGFGIAMIYSAGVVHIPNAVDDDVLYGARSGNLYIMNVTTDTSTEVAVIDLPTKGAFGAAWTDQDDRLYVSNNKGGIYLISDYDTATPFARALPNCVYACSHSFARA